MNKDQITALSLEKFYLDLNFIMACFQEVLRELGEIDLADRLPWVTRGAGGREPIDSLDVELQAYALAFQLLNMVEENTAAQTRRMVENQLGLLDEYGLWGHRLAQLRRSGLGAPEILEIFSRVHVEPVLTAHPSEAKRASVLEQHRALYLLFVERENNLWTKSEQKSLRDEMKAVLERLWRTGEILLEKPDLSGERRNMMYYLREIFPQVLPRLDRRLKHSWEAVGFDSSLLDEPGAMPRLSFGTWVGGDRDGHAMVTADVTRETLQQLRASALDLHWENLRVLAQHLSLSDFRQNPPDELTESVKRLSEELGRAGAKAMARNTDEPWRQFVNLMRVKLPGRHDPGLPPPTSYRRPRELHEDLKLLRRSLLAVNAHRLVAIDLMPVMRAVEVFGFHLASLDIRQNSGLHDKALAQLLAFGGIPEGESYADWPEERRMELLVRELASTRPFCKDLDGLEGEAKTVLSCYQVLAEHVVACGPEGIGSLIVSMTRRPSDMLAVYIFAREVGLLRNTPAGPMCPLMVVPLFETVADLEAAPETMRVFLDHPVTKASLRDRGEHAVQEIMVGYSDSSKGAGVMASLVELHRAQVRLSRVGRESGVRLRFFHGRGGTISRGAGPTGRFLEALPRGSFDGEMRVTEQGETIAQKYANLNAATYNLELLLAGVTAVHGPKRELESLEDRNDVVFERLAQRSQDRYREFLNADGFIQFYREATPIDAIEHSRIGSRPSRRTGAQSLKDLRAIPWVFAWTQSRFYLPGWYGIGTALTELFDDDPDSIRFVAQQMDQDPFWRYVITNVETSLLSANPDIMRAYAELVNDGRVRESFLDLVNEEYRKTHRTVDQIFGAGIEARRPRLWRTLQRRDGAMEMLHERQIRLLRTWRELIDGNKTGEAEKIMPKVLLSINAIASGLRTTG